MVNHTRRGAGPSASTAAAMSGTSCQSSPGVGCRAGRNAAAFGVPGLEIVTGHVPEALAGLPVPDAVFVGGGLATPGVLEVVWAALKPRGRLVANAVTLETEAVLLDGYARLGGELVRIEMARAEAVGPRQGWRPAMPILHWRVTKP